jgi:hypothetical protein
MNIGAAVKEAITSEPPAPDARALGPPGAGPTRGQGSTLGSRGHLQKVQHVPPGMRQR